MDSFYLIWLMTTMSKLVGTRAQESDVMQTSHKWQRRWICCLNPPLLLPHCLGLAPRGKGEQIEGEP
jgi:hypothetical protein